MLIKKTLWLFLGFVYLTSCGPMVTFTEPQPAKGNNLFVFPKYLQGNYKSIQDNSTLIINKTLIILNNQSHLKIHPNQLDSTEILKGDTIFNTKTKEKTPITRNGDSIIFSSPYNDTLFTIGPYHVLRNYKGSYFLNSLYEGDAWEVKKLEYKKGILTISSISTEKEIKDLKEITDIQDTTAGNKYSLTPKQLKEFIKQNGFSNKEIYIRQ